MVDYIVKDTELTSVANSIRTAGGTSSLLTFPNGFINAINNISGGGGGDFSTAKLTVSGGMLQTSLPELVDGGLLTLPKKYREGSYDIGLWKGAAAIKIQDEVTVSGDIEEEGSGVYIITGDCTITIS